MHQTLKESWFIYICDKSKINVVVFFSWWWRRRGFGSTISPQFFNQSCYNAPSLFSTSDVTFHGISKISVSMRKMSSFGQSDIAICNLNKSRHMAESEHRCWNIKVKQGRVYPKCQQKKKRLITSIRSYFSYCRWTKSEYDVNHIFLLL